MAEQNLPEVANSEDLDRTKLRKILQMSEARTLAGWLSLEAGDPFRTLAT